jgi:hypothetical protein
LSSDHLSADHRLDFWNFLLPWLGWLPYALLFELLSLFMLAPSVMSTLGGVAKPKLLASLTRSNFWMSKTERRECEA